ncbi:MAG: polymer-forming cytoskeletal protein [Patescibacteria group bacterium]|nr:polymer-forming cytoskeletal protein [Patescibacteria group bacterium]
MFKKEGDFGGGETIIAQGVKLEGDFKSEGNVVVEGEVNGTLTTTNDLRVGESARINADVKGQNAVIAGEVNGNMKISEKIELLASAKVNGDIETKILSVTPGAVINGKISMGTEMPAVAPMARGKKGARDIEKEITSSEDTEL